MLRVHFIIVPLIYRGWSLIALLEPIRHLKT